MKRIQRKRIKGWKMPPNTVYVGRPTKWGNPFIIGYTSPSDNTRLMTREDVVIEYERWLRQKVKGDPHFLDALRGKDLACWCPLDKPCHADVILKFLEGAEKQK
jgi:hypothetical protein